MEISCFCPDLAFVTRPHSPTSPIDLALSCSCWRHNKNNFTRLNKILQHCSDNVCAASGFLFLFQLLLSQTTLLKLFSLKVSTRAASRMQMTRYSSHLKGQTSSWLPILLCRPAKQQETSLSIHCLNPLGNSGGFGCGKIWTQRNTVVLSVVASGASLSSPQLNSTQLWASLRRSGYGEKCNVYYMLSQIQVSCWHQVSGSWRKCRLV